MPRKLRRFSPVKCQTPRWFQVSCHTSTTPRRLPAWRTQANGILPWVNVVSRGTVSCCCMPPVLGLFYPHTVKNTRITFANFALARFSTPRQQPPFGQGLKRTTGTGSNSQQAARFTNIIIPNAHRLSVSLLTPTSEYSIARSFTSP